MAELGTKLYFICAPLSKPGGETPSQIRAGSCRSVTKPFHWKNISYSAISWTLLKPIVLDEKLLCEGTRQGHTSLGGDALYNKMVDEKVTPGGEAIE